MPWKKTANMAMYKGANWENMVLTVHSTTPQQAARIALRNPQISFYFYCRDGMVLEPVNGNPERVFNAGDAVFFTGEPWLGSAPQCDTYEKNEMTVVYIDPSSPEQFKQIGCYVTADGSPSIDVVSIFAGNYASGQLPYLRANNNNPVTTNPFNQNIQSVLDSGYIQYLQAKGITVLLTVTNGWATVGWSEFTDEQDATDFASYLKTEVVEKYGLDGIDIDDEYSTGPSNTTSLPMVTTIMRQMMPDILLSKALWEDHKYFKSNWQGHTLASNLNYGWEMTYAEGDPNIYLGPYLQWGMGKNQLVLGFNLDENNQGLPQIVQEIVSEGYEGAMLFQFQSQPASINMMKIIVDNLCGAGNWNLSPDCV